MSREIRFRAWNGRFMEHGGFYVHATGEIQKESALGDVSSGCHLMQYTGLKDKDGVEIYEGDIIKAPGEYPAEIGFKFGTFILRHISHKGMNGTSISDVATDRYEVIGNIYSNPELLGGEK